MGLIDAFFLVREGVKSWLAKREGGSGGFEMGSFWLRFWVGLRCAMVRRGGRDGLGAKRRRGGPRSLDQRARRAMVVNCGNPHCRTSLPKVVC